jgi:pentatricopeptide repeat protein
MARWTFIALATSFTLIVIAAAQAGAGLLGHVWRGGFHIAGVGVAGGAVVPQQPFGAGKAPAWSTTDKAVEQLQVALKSRPDDPLTATRYAQLGSLYLQKVRETGDPSYYGKAEGVLQQALALAPENPLAMLGMGSLALSRHDFAGGIAWGQRVLAQAPRSYAAYGMLADGYTELGRYDEAVDALQQMIDLRPDQTSYSRVSYARELHGDLPNAIAAMQQAVASGAPRSEGTNWSRVQLGHLYFTSGDLDAADLQYRASLYFLPDYVHGLAGLAKVAAARGDLNQAAHLYNQALAVVPWPEYAIALGDVYRAMGNEAAAKKQDDLVRLIVQLQRAAGVDVDLEMALFEADHAPNAAALAAAVQNARAQYERRPSVHVADVLAWTLYRAGRPTEALPYAREALRLGSKDPLMLFHAGAVAAAAGERSEATSYLQAALAQNPNFSVRYAPEATKLLAQVQKQ